MTWNRNSTGQKLEHEPQGTAGHPVGAEVAAIGSVFRGFAVSSFVYLALAAVLGLILLSDSFQAYAERTQWVTVHWNLGFEGWLTQITTGVILVLASALAGRSVHIGWARAQFWLINAGLVAFGTGLVLTALTEGALGHDAMGAAPGRQVLTGLSEWGVTSYVWLLQLGYLAIGASFVVMWFNLRRTLHADAQTRARTGVPGLYYEAATLFFLAAAVGWLAWTIPPVREWLVSLPFLASGNGYQAVHHVFFIHLPVWGMGTFAIGAAYHSVPALTGRDTVSLTPRRELLFWVTILAIVGTMWHPKVTAGPPIYIGAVVVLLAIAVFKVFEFAGSWFHAALRRLTDPGYALVRNYFVAGILGFGVAAVIGTVLTVDPVNSRIFPEGAPGGQAGTLDAAVHGMQGMLTGLTPLLMGAGYLVARWALGAKLTPARLGNWVLAGLMIGSYGFLTALSLASRAGWMSSMAAQSQGPAETWIAIARGFAALAVVSMFGYFYHFWRITRPAARRPGAAVELPRRAPDSRGGLLRGRRWVYFAVLGLGVPSLLIVLLYIGV
jgi:hypothetical protein